MNIRAGFQSIVSTSWLLSISANDLKNLICGNLLHLNNNFNILDLFRIRKDDDVKENPILYSTFITIVNDDMNASDKRMFLKFVTGINKLPLPMSETIKIESPFLCFSNEEHALNLMRLPTAHTCFNTIELPNYVESMLELQYDGQTIDDLEQDGMKLSFLNKLKIHMKEKLMLAISNTDGSGYGLDEAVGNREAPNNNENVKQEEVQQEEVQELRRSVTIVRETEEPQPFVQEKIPREETPREETPRDEESDDSFGIGGLSDESDLDNLFDGF